MLLNFHRVLPEASRADVRDVARASLVNYCRYLVDFARLPVAGPDEVRAGCRDEGAFEQLRCQLEQRPGAIIVPMHFGSWDLGAAAAVAAGFDVTVVGDRFNDARLDDLVFGARERLGMKVVAADKLGLGLLRPLRTGGLLALLLDRPLAGDGVEAPFFGEIVEVPGGPARLALRTGAALVPVAFPRVSPGSAVVRVLADFSIDTRASGDLEVDVARLTAAVMAVHESYIRCYPDQWYMFREMWPRRAKEER